MNLSSQVLKTLKFTFKNPLRKSNTIDQWFSISINQQTTTNNHNVIPKLILYPKSPAAAPWSRKEGNTKIAAVFSVIFDSVWVSIHETGDGMVKLLSWDLWSLEIHSCVPYIYIYIHLMGCSCQTLAIPQQQHQQPPTNQPATQPATQPNQPTNPPNPPSPTEVQRLDQLRSLWPCDVAEVELNVCGFGGAGGLRWP